MFTAVYAILLCTSFAPLPLLQYSPLIFIWYASNMLSGSCYNSTDGPEQRPLLNYLSRFHQNLEQFDKDALAAAVETAI